MDKSVQEVVEVKKKNKFTVNQFFHMAEILYLVWIGTQIMEIKSLLG